MAHYLLQWKTDKDELEGRSRPPMNHLAGGQLDKVQSDDTLWIVNNEIGFCLIGKVEVKLVVSTAAEAKAILQTDSLFRERSNYLYAIAKSYTVEKMQWINISNIAGELRFDSENDRLDVEDGKVASLQILRIRKLTEESAQLLERKWYQYRNLDDIAKLDSDIQIDSQLTEDDTAYVSEFVEGGTVVRTVHQHVRNRSLVKAKKQEFRRQNDNRLFCEVCDFDFDEKYGVEYIEAHHKKPIADLDDETTTKLDDIALLCANCHRAIHCETPPIDFEEFKKRYEDRNIK